MNSVFIAGTDTGVGKSRITSLLLHYFQNLSTPIDVISQKWVQTGTEDDLAVHDSLLGRSLGEVELRLPYRFSSPVSPHLAAQESGETIATARIASSYQSLREKYGRVIIEGSGGLIVPLNRSVTMADLLETLGMPILLVAGNRVGAINHTLLSAAEIKRRRLPFLGVVFNAVDESVPANALEDNPKIVKNLGVRVLGSLPYAKQASDSIAAFSPIGRAIEVAWTSLKTKR